MCYKTNTKVLARADFNTNTKCVLLHKEKKLLAKRWRIAAEILAMYLRPRHRPTSFSRGFAKFAARDATEDIFCFWRTYTTYLPLGLPPGSSLKPELFIPATLRIHDDDVNFVSSFYSCAFSPRFSTLNAHLALSITRSHIFFWNYNFNNNFNNKIYSLISNGMLSLLSLFYNAHTKY